MVKARAREVARGATGTPFVVDQRGNSMAREMIRVDAKGPAVAGSGALDQHDGGMRPRGPRQEQRAGKLHISIAEANVLGPNGEEGLLNISRTQDPRGDTRRHDSHTSAA